MKKYLLILQAAVLALFFVSCDGKFTSTVVVKNLSQAEKAIMMTKSRKLWFQRELPKTIRLSGTEILNTNRKFPMT